MKCPVCNEVIDFMTQIMVDNARSHREWHRDRSCRHRKPRELSIPATTLVSDREEVRMNV